MDVPKKPIEDIQKKVQKNTIHKRERRRRTALIQVYLVGVSVAFVVLAIFARSLPYFPIDVIITKSIQQITNPYFSLFMQFISSFGFTPEVYIVVGTLLSFLLIAGLRWETLVGITNVASITIISLILKTIVHRPRPGEDLVHVFAHIKEYSFPSGHVMLYTAFFGYLFFLSFILLKKGLPRLVLLIIFGGLVLLVAPSRIYLGQHWASDTLGAYMVGTVWLILTIYVYSWGKKRYFVNQPTAPEKKS